MSQDEGAVLDEQGRRLDQIRLTGITATGYHGVFEHERREGQTFVADVVVHLDTRRAAARDDLEHTLHYGELAVQVAAVLAGEPVDLVETVAERIAATVLAAGIVAAVDVAVHKPQAPIEVPFGDVVVAIRRDRTKLPAAEPYVAVGSAGAQDATGAGVGRAPTPTATLPAVAAAVAAPVAASAAAPVGPGDGSVGEPVVVTPAPPAALPPGVVGGATAAIAAAAGVPSLPSDPTESDPSPSDLTPESPRGETPSGAVGNDVTPHDVVPHGGTPHDGTPHDGTADVVDAELVTDRFDVVPDGPVDVVLALGSNLGAPQDTLRQAVRDLADVDGIDVVEVSPLARTAPVGGPEQPDFLNAVVLARTTLSARSLLRATQAVERAHGRERHEHWGPRTLDVDIVVYGHVVGVSDDLELPHPRAHQRAFVLQPWAQVAPDAELPGLGGGPVAALAATAPDRDGVRWLALDWMTSPVPAASPEPAPASHDGSSAAVAPAPDGPPDRP
ncbi:2-amino-4-hydroxy-6-hydroxymethyldihydropteridine diphosphokinase [Cellulomonas sp. HZM]|uniref:2-amino-4-hydroxy-6- hydroxymethyldihydropteridine diphosphokinase n=1 Tax=Cellulomonas sp. HZM TaxID=1454010 RepID=UPI000AFE52B0|nr:2-amino-4-hydroxy-6-hydroxymethyldihydropteridine diphosphokinase [Cellulomonas sp. HZM]